MRNNNRYKYTRPLPSTEWKGKNLNLSLPIECVRVVYEVETAYGADHELVIDTLLDIFRSKNEIYAVILACRREFSGEEGSFGAGNRGVRESEREELIAKARSDASRFSRRLEALESDLVRLQTVALTTPGRPTTAGVSPASTMSTGSSDQASLGMRGGLFPGGSPDEAGQAITDSGSSSSGTSGVSGAQSASFLTTSAVRPTTAGTSLTTPATPDIRRQLIFGATPEISMEGTAEPIAALQAAIQSALEARDRAFATVRELSCEGDRETKRHDVPYTSDAAQWQQTIIKILYACIRSNADTGCRMLMRLIEKDVENYQKPPRATDRDMVIELDERRKLACWVHSLFYSGETRKSWDSDVAHRAYGRFVDQLNALERAKWNWIDSHDENPLARVLEWLLKQHTSVSQDTSVSVAALPAVKTSEKAARLLEPPAEDGEAGDADAPAKPAPPKRVKKSALVVDMDGEEPATPAPFTEETVIALIQKMTDRMASGITASLNQMSRDNQSRMDRMARETRENFSKIARQTADREQDRNRERERDRDYRTGWRDARRESDRPRGSEGERDYRAAENRGVATSSNRTPLGQRNAVMRPACTFKPQCHKPGCDDRFSHEPGQYKPDIALFNRREEFRKAGKCVVAHDTGFCQRTRCNRQHGSVSPQGAKPGAAVCQHVGKSMCPAFYTIGGCDKAHRQ